MFTHGKSKLFREKELRSREGSRRASASHGTRPAIATRTAHGSPPVPVEGPMRKYCTAEDCRAHSVCAGASAHNIDAAMMEDERGNALFVLAGLGWCPRQAREQLGMYAHMNTSCTIRHARHGRLMCSQAAGRQWISQTMDIFDCTSCGQLHKVLVHAAVQWFASVCCMCG